MMDCAIWMQSSSSQKQFTLWIVQYGCNQSLVLNKTDYIIDCAIGMQLHSHGLVKNLLHGLHNEDATTFPRSS